MHLMRFKLCLTPYIIPIEKAVFNFHKTALKWFLNSRKKEVVLQVFSHGTKRSLYAGLGCKQFWVQCVAFPNDIHGWLANNVS